MLSFLKTAHINRKEWERYEKEDRGSTVVSSAAVDNSAWRMRGTENGSCIRRDDVSAGEHCSRDRCK